MVLSWYENWLMSLYETGTICLASFTYFVLPVNLPKVEEQVQRGSRPQRPIRRFRLEAAKFWISGLHYAHWFIDLGSFKIPIDDLIKSAIYHFWLKRYQSAMMVVIRLNAVRWCCSLFIVNTKVTEKEVCPSKAISILFKGNQPSFYFRVLYFVPTFVLNWSCQNAKIKK